MADDFDVIIVGSGITGGWAAKEFCEQGFKTLVLERGRHLDHPDPEYTDMTPAWDMYNRALMPESYDVEERYRDLKEVGYAYWDHVAQFFVDEKDYPYSNPEGRPAMWVRGYQLGGRSITWGRQSYRWGAKDFEANAKDGHGVPWPIGYEDLATWYDYVEEFAGISGARDELDVLPDGEHFLKPWQMSCAEQFVADNLKQNRPNRPFIMGRCANLSEAKDVHTALGRGACQARNQCIQGCGFGAYFCSLSSTLPAARQTGNLTIVTDAIVASVDHDPMTGRATGVTAIDHNTLESKSYKGRIVVLCASAFGSVQILLNSRSEAHPNGLGNSSGLLGRYIMDHFGGAGAGGTVPGFEDRYSFGRRPTGIYIPNFRHEPSDEVEFVRGYGYQGYAAERPRRGHTGREVGIGAAVKAAVGAPLPWWINLYAFCEMLPYADNQISLHNSQTDKWGIPLLHIDAYGRDNERKMLAQAAADAEDMLTAGGCTNIRRDEAPPDQFIAVGTRIHEMGGACMGDDPGNSVTNKWCQLHDVPNVFVTDGACMSSCATQNPSLTYMAMTARAAHHAGDLMRENVF